MPTVFADSTFRTALALLLVWIGADRSPAEEPLRLLPGVPVVVAASEPPQVKRAAQDLCRDLGWVLETPSPLFEEPPKSGPAIVISSQPNLGHSSGAEAHRIAVQGNQVWLQGGDARGAIYAIYSFSDEFLDVPPWWYWAGWKPTTRSKVEIPAATNRSWQSPQVKWRAWFPNDTDLLSPWISEDYNARWNLVLETMLRLKLNLIDVGELSEETLRKIRLPRDRGVAVTTTHLAPFGASLRNWEKFWTVRKREPVPPLLLANTKDLEQFWEEHIRLIQKENVEMLWMIGFRGDGDKGFYRTFADAPTDDAARANVVENMLRRQVALLKRVTGDEAPPMRTVIYDECSDYVAAGLLHPPEDPSLIWNFTAARRDHFPAADLRNFHAPPGRQLGYYFNIQFTSTGSHLADGEGPWKMERNHRMVLESGPSLALSVVNSGNTREFPLSLAAHARMMWSFSDYDTDAFTKDFCRRYWGPIHGPAVAELYQDFFDSYWQQREPNLPDFPRQYIFHDLRIARATRDLLHAATDKEADAKLLDERDTGYFRIIPANGETKVDAIRAGMSRSAERFAQVSKRCAELSAHLDEQGRPLFDESLRMQAAFMEAASRCLAAAAEGYQVRNDREDFLRCMKMAQKEAGAMEGALRTATKPPFEAWFAKENIFDLKETRALIDRRVQGKVKPVP
jgi:hypothetical protein